MGFSRQSFWSGLPFPSPGVKAVIGPQREALEMLFTSPGVGFGSYFCPFVEHFYKIMSGLCHLLKENSPSYHGEV